MRKEKHSARLLAAVVFGMVVIWFSAVPVSANSPPPSPDLVVDLIGKPAENVAFVDILIPLAADAAEYSEYNPAAEGKFPFGRDSEIVQYNKDGFISYTFHYDGAKSTIGFEKAPYSSALYVRFENGSENLGKAVDSFKVAFLSAEGDAIYVSDVVQIADTFTGYFTGGVTIHAKTMQIVDDGFFVSPYMILFLPFRAIPRVAFSVLIEVLIAMLFKIRPLRKVVVLNCITQFVLTIFMMTVPFSYWLSVLVGEVAVYLAEGIAMPRLYKNIEKKKLILYVLVANTATLCLGLLLNCFGIFKY